MKMAAIHYNNKNRDVARIVDYSDNDYTKDITRKSIAGHIFMLASSVIS